MHHETRKGALGAALLLGVFTLGACERELPTEVGGEHLPESSLRTYEIILQDEVFLIGDSLVRGFGTSDNTPILLVAENYRDTLDAHALIRFGEFPETVTYSDSNGTHTDTIVAFTGGRITLRVDTLALRPDTTLSSDTSVTFEMYEVAESFDPRTVTWDARVATASDTTLWSVPGGTPGDLIGTRTWTWTKGDSLNTDSVVFTLDSATVAEWETGGQDQRAILISTTTNGVRAQVIVPRLALSVRIEDDDEVRTANAVVNAGRYVYDPPPPPPGAELRVGDYSAWRSFLQFAPGLDTLDIPCPDDPTGCSFRLGDVTINRAELWLTPLAVPEVFWPRGEITLELRPVFGAETLPLERAPLGDTTGVARNIEPETFAADGDSLVRASVSRFVRGLIQSDTALTERNRTLAIVSVPEPLSFGIARFGGFGSDYAPVLRIIVTLPPREEEE